MHQVLFTFRNGQPRCEARLALTFVYKVSQSLGPTLTRVDPPELAASRV